jgi:HEAT repeat protein
VITINRNIGFFSNSARYYFMLRAFVQAHYVLVARFGRYDVLARRELATGPFVDEEYTPAVDDRLISSLAEPLYEPRRAAMEAFLARAETPEGVTRLADVVAPDPVSRLLLLRAFSETPDVRALPLLARTIDETHDRRVQREAAFALTYMALDAAEHRYLLGRRPDEPGPSLDDLAPLIDAATVRRWLADRDARASVGAFAIWFLAGTRDPEAVPLLEAVYRSEPNKPYLQMLAAHSLVRAGRLEYLCELVTLLGDKRHDYQDGVPSMLLDAAAEHPSEVALCLAEGLLDPRRRGREVSAWTAGAAGLRATAPALRGALADPEWRVRAAATWALGRIGDAEARPDLARLAGDEDSGIRAFAAEALARLDQPDAR